MKTKHHPKHGAAREHPVARESSAKKPPKAPLPRGRVCVGRGELEPECAAFPRLLRVMRDLTHWSLRDLSGVTHLSRQYHHDMEYAAVCNPTLDVLSRVARAHRLDLVTLMRLLCRVMKGGAASVPRACPV
jgi:hypothetical protein